MPRIDPMTGVTVMTTAEFFMSEAEREGKGRSGAEVMTDTFAGIAAEMDADEQRERLFFSDPANAWEAIRHMLREELEAEESQLQAVELVGVLAVSSKQSMRGSSLGIEAHVKFNDGAVRRVQWSFQHWAGSYWEPDDYDESVEWVDEPLEVLDEAHLAA